MDNLNFICHYIYKNKQYVLNGEKSLYLDSKIDYCSDHININLYPKFNVELVDAFIIFDHKYLKKDKFFANGYQSWSTSKEYQRDDMQKGVFKPLSSKLFIEKVGLTTDYRICNNEKRRGHFHSHCYTYIKSDDKLLFVGSLSERQGYTVFHCDMKHNIFSIEKDIKGIVIDKPYQLFNLAVIKGVYNKVFDEYFKLLNIGKPKIEHLAGYTSWYNYFTNINEEIILRDLNALDIVNDKINIFQIDDGYEKAVGDWITPDEKKFPNGLKIIANEIHSKNLLAGLWLAPFNVQPTSKTYQEHPEWVVQDKKGKPIVGCNWPAYILDIYNTDVRNHLKNVFDVILSQWGFDLVKLDFLYSSALWPRDNKSRGEIMCDSVDFLRECCGEKLILGCGLPLGASFGKIDACRIGCDSNSNYNGSFASKLPLNDEFSSAQMSINNSIFRRHLNNRAFLNDPDVFFLRKTNIHYTKDQKILLALINHILGDVIFMSDDMTEYDNETIEFVKKIYDKSNCTVEDVNYSPKNKTFTISIINKDKEKVVLVFNLKTGNGNQQQVFKELIR